MASLTDDKVIFMRRPAQTYPECIVPDEKREVIDVERALDEHQRFADMLRACGRRIVVLEPLHKYPDSVFIEDAAIPIGDVAFLCPFSVPSRQGEELLLSRDLTRYKNVDSFVSPASIDGGDVIQTESDVFIGLSSRTNRVAVSQLAKQLPRHRVVPVEIDSIRLLHLKSAATYLGRRTFLVASRLLDPAVFASYTVLETPSGEEYAANCLAIDENVFIPTGYPKTAVLLRRNGYDVIEVDISEFAKGNGSVSCLCLVL